MKPVQQTIFMPDPHANCLQAALASILELNLDAVPNFSWLYTGDEADLAWWAMDEFLLFYGLQHVTLEPNQSFTPRGYHLIDVVSPRSEDSSHVLVGFQGVPAYDPHPGGECKGEVISWVMLVSTMVKEIHLLPQGPILSTSDVSIPLTQLPRRPGQEYYGTLTD